MILVDSSVWVDYFRSATTPQVELLERLVGQRDLAVGDLIAIEVLQGVRDEKQFDSVQRTFARMERIPLGGYDLAVDAARNYRRLRELGITVRKTIDTLIATRCIRDRLHLLHADRDFRPFAQHLGLKEAYLPM